MSDERTLIERLRSLRFYTDGSGPEIPDCVPVTCNLQGQADEHTLSVGDLRAAATALEALREELEAAYEQNGCPGADCCNESFAKLTKMLHERGHCETCNGTGEMDAVSGYNPNTGEEQTRRETCGECAGVAGTANAERRSDEDQAKERIKELEADATESDATRQRMADLLSQTAVALRGPEPPLTRWSWHDLPELAKVAMERITQFEAALAEAHARGDRWSLLAQETQAVAENRERIAFEAGMSQPSAWLVMRDVSDPIDAAIDADLAKLGDDVKAMARKLAKDLWTCVRCGAPRPEEAEAACTCGCGTFTIGTGGRR